MPKAENSLCHKKDSNGTGTPEAQITSLTAKINRLTEDHFPKHKKDKHSRRGLVKAIHKRRRILAYLKRQDSKRYSKVTEVLDLHVPIAEGLTRSSPRTES